MALDGITVAALCFELSEKLIGGRVDKLSQPEKDELVLAIRSKGENFRLLLTANASQPRIQLTKQQKENPMTAPLFCMVLRKHLQGGRIISINQPNFERIITIEIESPDEMRDLTIKRLIIEIMGKHSNIMLVDTDGIILDSVKHVTHETSSVREVLPGKRYVLPPSQDKLNPMLLDWAEFLEKLNSKPGVKLQNFIYQQYTGISPVMASEICHRAGLDASRYCAELDEKEKHGLFTVFYNIFSDIKNHEFFSCSYRDDKKLVEFAALQLTQYSLYDEKRYESVSELVEDFYRVRDGAYRNSQKTQDLRKLISTLIERCVRKKDQNDQTMHEIENRETYRKLGELVRANLYLLKLGMASFEAVDFFSESGEMVVVPLVADKNPIDNMQHYFKLYNKQKRTYTALIEQAAANETELSYLDSVLTMLSGCSLEAELEEVKAELIAGGYIKKRQQKGKAKVQKTKLQSYRSSEGFEILVGKNNTQNDELTFKLASPNDVWLHAKNIPGSHVIILCDGKTPGDETLEYAAKLASFYSKAKGANGTAVDYTAKKHVKKPNGAKPGFVIYETNKTVYVGCDEEEVWNTP